MQAIDLGPAALSEEADGTIRVGRTRVTLDTVEWAVPDTLDAGSPPVMRRAQLPRVLFVRG